MTDITLAGSESETFGGLGAVLEEKGEPYRRLNLELTDPRFFEAQGEDFPATIVARFHEGDLASIKAMQSYRLKKPCAQFIFLTNKPISTPVLTLMFNEGAFGILEEPIAKESALLLVRQAIKKSKWDMDELARGEELAQINKALQGKLDRLETEQSRLREIVDQLERMLLKTLSDKLFKASRVKILLVSASDYQRNVLSEEIGKAGFNVTTCKDGKEAMSLLKKVKPNIVVSDLELDDMSGMELAANIKSDASNPNAHYIVITSSPEKAPHIMAPGGGVDDCVVKQTSGKSHYQLVARIALGALNL